MQSQENKFNISITLGNNKDLPLLTDTTINLIISEEKAKQTQQILKIQDYKNDMILHIQFCVEAGREKQFVEYIEKGMDEENKNLSPLQRLFLRPKSSGKIQLRDQPGRVMLIYTFYGEYLYEIKQLIETIEQKKLSLDFNLKFELKGRVSHNKKNRTEVKVDYANFQGYIDANAEKFFQLLYDGSQLPEQFSEIPLFHMIGSLKSANIKLKLESFRMLRRFYKKANNNPDTLKQVNKKSFPYVTKGLIKEFTSVTLLYKQKYMIKSKINYHSEDIFMRLIKIFRAFATKINEEFEQQQADE